MWAYVGFASEQFEVLLSFLGRKTMSSVEGLSSASDIQVDYMRLLVTQLQNQNPLEPLDNNEMASQLAQFTQLQQLETMNTSFSEVLKDIQREYASSLIGKEISFLADDGSGTTAVTTGAVEQVYNNVNGKTVLVTGDYIVGLDDVISVKAEAAGI
jgi:flagellar basal-body rod modification protein FlgD